MASGRPGAFLNPVTPKVNRVKELFFFNDQRDRPLPTPQSDARGRYGAGWSVLGEGL